MGSRGPKITYKPAPQRKEEWIQGNRDLFAYIGFFDVLQVILILIPGKGVGAVSKRAFSPLPIGAGDGCTTYFVTFSPATRGYPGGAVSQRHPINDVPRATGGARTN